MCSSKSQCGCLNIREVKSESGVQPAEQSKLSENDFNKTIIVLSGPTGVGKTKVSLDIAEKLNGEIISADSVQVYRGMDIGTAKVSLKDRKRIPHHLIDVCDITEPFNVVHFYEAAKRIIEDIFSRNKVPIIVGGTGFYIHTLLYGPPEGPPSDKVIRDFLEAEAERFGVERLYERLQCLDPDYAKTITKSDGHKIVRALEIMQLSGKKVSSFAWKERKLESSHRFLCYFMHMPRKMLYPLLERRCEEMLADGLLQEVVHLDRLGIRTNSTAKQAIGYKQSLKYLDTAKTKEDYTAFIEEFKTASRHLAKRQFTWFRKEPLFLWVDMTQLSPDAFIELIVQDFYKK